MQKLLKVFDWHTYTFTAIAVIGFSNIVVQLFGQTIPNVMITFFRNAGEVVILGSVFLFAAAWLIKARPHNRPKKYDVVVFDVFGAESKIDGIRTEFKTHDVAWSFMKQYKDMYPLYNFALVSKQQKQDKPTIFKYI
ncbi:MAG TPA: hypothetical protein VMW74_03505 [Nitrosopumilaceae archaeon]|nr:hypothetical protein [Nitrosopumilaceae archaeon]